METSKNMVTTSQIRIYADPYQYWFDCAGSASVFSIEITDTDPGGLKVMKSIANLSPGQNDFI